MPVGYENIFVEEVPEDYICCICRLTMRKPVQTKCGHRFCKFCLTVSMKSSSRCPVDRVLLTHQDLFNDKATERKILSFKIKCTNEGCDWQGELRDILVHTKECPMAIVPCTYQMFGCGIKVERKSLSEHILTKHLAFTTGKLLELQTENTSLKRRLVDLEIENEKLKVQVVEAKSLVDTKHNQPLSKYVWKVKDFGIKLVNAKEKNLITSLSSGPFYTDKYGYKLKLKMYPNGDGVGKGTHLSLYLIIMRGDYDGMLSWPFSYRVKFTLVDQKPDIANRKNIELCFTPSNTDVNESFLKPQLQENTGYGFTTFVSHTDILTENYLNISDGSIFLQLEIEDC